MVERAAPERRARRRADAERNVVAILDAALTLLSERPLATMDDIAQAAGVARQTVYAHYASREALLEAIQARALREAVDAIDAVEPDQGPPAESLDRLVRACWDVLGRHARVTDSLMARMGPEQLHSLHRPILDQIEPLIRRGQRAGSFDRELPVAWTLAAIIGLFHATALEVGSGRLSREDGEAALRRVVPRVLAP